MLVLQPADVARYQAGAGLNAAMLAVHRSVRGFGQARGIVEKGSHVVVQASLVAFQGQDVVAALGHNLSYSGAQ